MKSLTPSVCFLRKCLVILSSVVEFFLKCLSSILYPSSVPFKVTCVDRGVLEKRHKRDLPASSWSSPGRRRASSDK